MKKILLIALCVLMVLCFAACGEETPNTTEPPVQQIPVYWNLSKTLPTPEGNGAYALSFLLDGQTVTYTCTDEALAELICRQDVLGLTLEGKTIKDAILSPDLPYRMAAWNWYIKSMGGDQVKLNAVSTFNGADAVLTITPDSRIYDVSALAEYPGKITELQKNDGITALVNDKDEILFAFVSDRATVPDEKATYCAHCEKDVVWNGWHSPNQLPISSGHYRLEKDITLTATNRLGDVNVVLDLNGKRVEQTTDGQRIYYIPGKGELSILDSVGSGVMRSANTYDTGSCASRWGMIIDIEDIESTVNLYSGTLDASGRSTQYGGAINSTLGTVNMYGGTILAADPYGTGSGAIRVGGVFNMYAGKIVGGTHKDIGYQSINVHAGAVLRVGEGAIMNMYGGEIVGGESYTDGGIIGVMNQGTLNLYGGSISGGKCAGRGGAVFVSGGSKVKICGNPQVWDNEGSSIFFDIGTFLEVDELLLGDAKVGISMEIPGTLGACSTDKILDCLISDDPTQKIVLKNGFLSMD